jgi:hypothetical protein
MKFLRKRHLHYIFILLLVGGVLATTYVFLVSYAENKVEQNLVAVNGRSASFQIDLLARSLHFQQFEILPSPEVPIGLQLRRLDIEGINLYALLIDKTIVINNVRADSGKLLINRPIEEPVEDATKKTSSSKLNKFRIKNLSLNNISTELRTDTVINFSGVLVWHATEVTLERIAGKMNYSLQTLEGSSREISINRNSGMYGLTMDQLHYSSKEQKLTIDSILLTPHYDKYEFAHKKGEQVGRVNLSVPKIIVEGIVLREIIDTVFTASKIEITSFDLHSFKDKRVPYVRTRHILLPMESLQKLSYPVSIDSLVIKDSRVTLEEISENGTESGTVTIDHINSAAGLITNQYKKGMPRDATLKASGMLMDQGEINAVFLLPLDGSPTYRTTGSISKFPFEKLNPALENIARIKIESGQLNNMKFDFRYTDIQSNGTVEIDYENLRIIGLNKKNDDQNDFKTLVINVIVKNTKDRTMTRLQRTGAINIERDRTRYIFNVWWKSILDGLRSSILGIEKNQDPKK